MLKLIKTRRSIRKFTPADIEDQTVNQIIEMGAWAPSGLNNQPWKFVIIRNKKIKDEIALLTRCSRIIQDAPVLIAVFLDHSLSYNMIKDIQAIGACIQNMLLTIHYIGLGGVWLGEILKNREPVEKVLMVPEKCELMAIIALGHPAEEGKRPSRKDISELIISRN